MKIRFEDVYADERAYLQRRREQADDDRASTPIEPTVTVKSDLVGVALSGGGVRSATVALGALQALHRRGVFRFVDLLSTVSGGGFLGSTITSLMSRGKAEFPLDHQTEEGARALRHLRAHSSYLTPSGAWDYAAMAIALFRGMVLNMLVFTPFLLLFCAATVFWFGPRLQARDAYDRELNEATAVIDSIYGDHFGTARPVRALSEVLVRDHYARTKDPILQTLQGDGSASMPSLIHGAASDDLPTTFVPDTTTRDVAERLLTTGAIELETAFELRMVGKTLAESIGLGINESTDGRVLRQYLQEQADQASSDLTGAGFEPEQAVFGVRAALTDDMDGVNQVLGTDRWTPKTAAIALYDKQLLNRYWFEQQMYCEHEHKSTGPARLPLCASPQAGRRCPAPHNMRVADYHLQTELHCHYLRYQTDAGLIDRPKPSEVMDPWKPKLWGTRFLIVASLVLVLLSPLVEMALRSRRLRLRAQVRANDVKRRLAILIYDASFAGTLAALVALFAAELIPYAVYHFHALRSMQTLDWSVAISIGSLAATALSGPVLQVVHRSGRVLGAVVMSILVPALPIIAYLQLVTLVVYGTPDSFVYSEWLLGSANAGGYDISMFHASVLLALASVVLFLAVQLIDVNATSLHTYYRDGIARGYLHRRNAQGVAVPTLALHEINPTGSCAPYHLINAALNLQRSSEMDATDRMSDFLCFSGRYVGGPRTGYCTSQAMARAVPELRFDSSIAISGAAAAPAMGVYSDRKLGFFMTLLNLRMGYWMPHPGWVHTWFDDAASKTGPLHKLWRRARLRPSGWLLLYELLGLVGDAGRTVNVSDGGHLENSGAFELLRRRCRFIIIIDAEADAEMGMGALAALCRYARMDLGVEIDIDMDALRPDESGLCSRHGAVGRVRYPTDDGYEEGVLLYLKSSVTGDEDEIIHNYRTVEPSFPHETTADQFFDEVQFETYRSLGFHMVQSVFPRVGSGRRQRVDTFQDLADWFASLSVSLTPSLSGDIDLATVASLQTQIDSEMHNPLLAGYVAEIFPELGIEATLDLERDDVRTALLKITGTQLRLMQVVFYSVELDSAVTSQHPSAQNWVNMFRTWTASPAFRRMYALQVGTLGRRFTSFAEHSLGLKLLPSWREPGPHPRDVAVLEQARAELPTVDMVVDCLVAGRNTGPVGAGCSTSGRVWLLPSHNSASFHERAVHTLTHPC